MINNRVFVISGATASGKSSVLQQLSSKKDIAIINADSLQIYKDLPILSAQPSRQEFAAADHYLYSYLDHDQGSNVADWLNNLTKILKNLDKQAFIVGGSGMYISKLIDGINQIPAISDEVKRDSEVLFAQQGEGALISEIKSLASDDYQIKFADKNRLLRQHQVLKQTGRTIESFYQDTKKFVVNPDQISHLNLEIPRQQLYDSIDNRFLQMIEVGAIEEVAALHQKVQDNDQLQVTKTLGYYEIRDFLQNKIDQQKMLELATQKTRNYAKRQSTWFRHQFKDNKKVFNSAKLMLEYLYNEV